MSKTLILYYSFEGNTKKIADIISKNINAEVEQVKPVNDLKSKGFSKYILGGFQVVMGKKPELNPISANLDDYDTILLGSPVWGGSFAPAIKTLLENGIIKGKKIGYFYCHKGGDINVVEKVTKSIKKENVFVSAIGCKNAIENIGKLERDVVAWAKGVVEK